MYSDGLVRCSAVMLVRRHAVAWAHRQGGEGSGGGGEGSKSVALKAAWRCPEVWWGLAGCGVATHSSGLVV